MTVIHEPGGGDNGQSPTDSMKKIHVVSDTLKASSVTAIEQIQPVSTDKKDCDAISADVGENSDPEGLPAPQPAGSSGSSENLAPSTDDAAESTSVPPFLGVDSYSRLLEEWIEQHQQSGGSPQADNWSATADIDSDSDEINENRMGNMYSDNDVGGVEVASTWYDTTSASKLDQTKQQLPKTTTMDDPMEPLEGSAVNILEVNHSAEEANSDEVQSGKLSTDSSVDGEDESYSGDDPELQQLACHSSPETFWPKDDGDYEEEKSSADYDESLSASTNQLYDYEQDDENISPNDTDISQDETTSDDTEEAGNAANDSSDSGSTEHSSTDSNREECEHDPEVEENKSIEKYENNGNSDTISTAHYSLSFNPMMAPQWPTGANNFVRRGYLPTGNPFTDNCDSETVSRCSQCEQEAVEFFRAQQEVAAHQLEDFRGTFQQLQQQQNPCFELLVMIDQITSGGADFIGFGEAMYPPLMSRSGPRIVELSSEDEKNDETKTDEKSDVHHEEEKIDKKPDKESERKESVAVAVAVAVAGSECTESPVECTKSSILGSAAGDKPLISPSSSTEKVEVQSKQSYSSDSQYSIQASCSSSSTASKKVIPPEADEKISSRGRKSNVSEVKASESQHRHVAVSGKSPPVVTSFLIKGSAAAARAALERRLNYKAPLSKRKSGEHSNRQRSVDNDTGTQPGSMMNAADASKSEENLVDDAGDTSGRNLKTHAQQHHKLASLLYDSKHHRKVDQTRSDVGQNIPVAPEKPSAPKSASNSCHGNRLTASDRAEDTSCRRQRAAGGAEVHRYAESNGTSGRQSPHHNQDGNHRSRRTSVCGRSAGLSDGTRLPRIHQGTTGNAPVRVGQILAPPVSELRIRAPPRLLVPIPPPPPRRRRLHPLAMRRPYTPPNRNVLASRAMWPSIASKQPTEDGMARRSGIRCFPPISRITATATWD